jgi:hypothetical protein
VLTNQYAGDMVNVEMLVRGRLMFEEIECPADGPMALDMCLRHQEREQSDIQNGWHRDMYKACRSGCGRFRGKK